MCIITESSSRPKPKTSHRKDVPHNKEHGYQTRRCHVSENETNGTSGTIHIQRTTLATLICTHIYPYTQSPITDNANNVDANKDNVDANKNKHTITRTMSYTYTLPHVNHRETELDRSWVVSFLLGTYQGKWSTHVNSHIRTRKGWPTECSNLRTNR